MKTKKTTLYSNHCENIGIITIQKQKMITVVNVNSIRLAELGFGLQDAGGVDHVK